MNNYLLILMLFFFFTACEDYESQELPTSGGGIDEAVMILADKNLRTPLSDTLAYYLLDLFPALPQYAPKINLKIRSYSQMKAAGDALQKYRNIIFAGSLDKNNSVSKRIKNILSEEMQERARTDSTFFFVIKKNELAKPQQIYYLFAPTEADLVDRVSKYGNILISAINDFELNKIASAMYGRGTSEDINNKLQEKFNISLKVPDNFQIVEEDSNFILIGLNKIYKNQDDMVIREVRQSMVVQSVPLSDTFNIWTISNPFLDSLGIKSYPIALRDSFSQKYLTGRTDSFFMYIDYERNPLFQKETSLNGKYALETRGLWRIDNPFQGGSFLNYTLYDEDNNRLLILDGFTFAAGENIFVKRKLIRQFEVIAKSIEYGKVKFARP